MRVLVVDDFATMRRIIRTILNEIGITNVDEASDGAEALKRLRARNYDLLITDWNMPNMDGIELIKTVRNDTKQPQLLPIIMVTANTARELIIQAANAGVNGYIVKPFQANTLRDKIDLVFKRLSSQ